MYWGKVSGKRLTITVYPPDQFYPGNVDIVGYSDAYW